MAYAPPVISGGGATAGAGPAGSEFVAPAAAFAGQGFLAPGPAWGGESDPGAAAPVPTQATIQLPPPPPANSAAPPPPPAPQAGAGAAAEAPPAASSSGTSPVLRRKCLLVACNYQGTSAALKGCGNDQQCMRHCLKTRFGFRDEEILALFDGQPDPRLWPTRANILAAMRWLVADARAGDSLFFHYSGHGAQTQDWSGDEADGYNETLCPCDFRNGGGMIVDDELNAVLVNPLPPGAVLTAVVDACEFFFFHFLFFSISKKKMLTFFFLSFFFPGHSGSVLDLEFRTEFNGNTAAWQQEYARRPSKPKGTAGGIALAFSAARDGQVAADTAALSGTVSTGAATFAFISAIERDGTNITLGRLLHSMHELLSRSIGTADGDGAGGGGGPSPAMPSLGGILGQLLGVNLGLSRGGQNPVLTASSAVDLNSPIRL